MKNDKGLTAQQAQALLKQFGKNTISKRKHPSIVTLFISQYTNLLVAILFLAVVFSYLIHEVVDSIIILAILILNGLFSFIQEYRAEKTLEKLQGLTVPLVRVLRDGKEVEIDAKSIVPGDRVILREGDRIPADGKLVSNLDMEIDESVLTGESMPVNKKSNDSLFAGTFIVQGRGYMVVEKTGSNTSLGEIAKQIGEAEKPKTPLSTSLDALSKRIAIFALAMSLLLIPIGYFQGRMLRELLLMSVSLAVAVIPEGLPLVVTVALAVGAFQMAKAKTIVRKMAAIETLGATTVILSDKTGTITQNEMRVKKHFLLDSKELNLMLRAATLGNTASFIVEDEGKKEIVGDKTDGAFLLYAHEKIKDYEKFRQEGEVVEEKPFNSITKTIEVVWRDNNDTFTFVRGAPESVLALVGKEDGKKIEREFKKFISEGLRVIAFAYRKNKGEFRLLGIVGIYDPPRPEARDAIVKAKKAGIKILMVTGDNPDTALTIAKDVGLAEPYDQALTHDEIEKLSDIELSSQLDTIRVFARMMPTDKLRIVNLLKKKDEIVAVTGDGVNDALALSESHIGVAMGETGTDVAKAAADIVITDDNLSTIIRAVEEGRSIYKNITRVVVFLFSANITEFLLIFLGMIFALPLPLTATQILWVNLVSDGVPALALATDAKSRNVLLAKPRPAHESILSKERIKQIVLIAVPFVGMLFVLYIMLLNFFPIETARFIVFNVLVVGEMVTIFIIRRGIFPKNKFLYLSVVVTLLIQLIIISTPVFRSFLM